jgi:hypothetical protein
VFCHQCGDLVYDDIFADVERRSRWTGSSGEGILSVDFR